jgi:hypothetical protein
METSSFGFSKWLPTGRGEKRRPGRARAYACPVRAMFVIWIVLIAAGIVLFSIIGLTHG